MFIFLKKLFFHFFPFTCPSCKKESVNSSFELCDSCFSKLNFISKPYCKACGGSNDTIFDICTKCLQEKEHPWPFAISIFEMKDLSRDLIIKYKYYKDIPLALYFSKLIYRKVIEADLNVDVVTYIPLHWIKYIKRGFNQSFILAEKTSSLLNIPRKTLLRRKRYTKSQTKLSTIYRRKNIKGAFVPLNQNWIKNKKILLIDDVYTTGATLREATNILLKSQAKEVVVLTLARR